MGIIRRAANSASCFSKKWPFTSGVYIYTQRPVKNVSGVELFTWLSSEELRTLLTCSFLELFVTGVYVAIDIGLV